jgi:Ricin-type beta-trefoil lectin domain/Putative Ig domain
VKIRALTAGAIVTTVAAAAVVTAGVVGAVPGIGAATSAASAAAATPAVPSVHVPGMRIRVVNLHQQFARALARNPVVTGPEAGIVPVLTGRRAATASTTAIAATLDAASASNPTAAATTTSCQEPNCDLTWQGGAVQHSPHVYLLLWGPKWTHTSLGQSVANYLTGFFYGLGQTSYDSWSTITSQYADKTGHPSFSKALLNPGTDVINDTNAPPSGPNGVTQSDIASEALSMMSTFGITGATAANAQVIVASQSGTCFSDGFAGNPSTNCTPTQNYDYCGWHSAAQISSTSTAYLPYINLPWQLDAGYGCGANFVNGGSAGLLDGWSLIGGHEYAETVTDPNPDKGYIDLNDQYVSGGEIADKCVWGGQPFGVNDPYGDVTLSTGTFAMQSLWSNAAGGCVMTTSPRLYVPTPATQKSNLGKTVSLQLTAKTNTGVQSYKATGLPPGLSINASTGRITGRPSVTAGTFRPKITISDYAKRVTISFTWFVSSATGAVKGYGAKCVDDSGSHTGNGNKIDIWNCNGTAAQRITFMANRELQVVGKCVTGGMTTFLEPCRDTSNQAWTRLANGEYVLAATGKCLTDPANSKVNGTRLTLAACKNTASQHWSLP